MRPSFVMPILIVATSPWRTKVVWNSSSRDIRSLTGPALGTQGQRDGRALHADAGLTAEAAADVGRDDPQPRVVDVQGLRDQVALGEGRLAGRPERDLPVDVLLCDADVRLERHVLDVRHPVLVLVDQVGLGPALLHVALAHLHPVRDIRARLGEDERDALVGAEVGMDERRFGRRAEFRVEHAGQFLVLDLDQLQRLLGQLERVGGDGRDGFAEVADAVEREDAPVLEVQPRVAGEVLAA